MGSRIIFHIDVNSAYLSWSALRRLQSGDTLDLRTVPSIIGGDQEKRHGIVLAKSIPAKKYGIQTAEPIVNALRKCPTLLIERPDHSYYEECSHRLMELLRSICPEIEQLSIDECFMDFSPIQHLYSSPIDAANEIKQRIYDSFGFTVNIGISNCKVLAKMASDFEKPDRVHTLFPEELSKKMWPLPVSSLYMCGHSSVQVLHNLGINTIGELAATDSSILSMHLKSHGLLLWQYANGIDDSPVISTPTAAKGIGNSTTLAEDITDVQLAYSTLLSLAESVGSRLRKSGQNASTLSVEIKYSDFQSVSRQTSLNTPTSTTQIIYETSCKLFDELWNGSPIRLLGIRSAKLTSHDEPVQLSLFDDLVEPTAKNEPGKSHPSTEKLKALDSTLDAIREKYGKDAIVRGSFRSRPTQVDSHKEKR